MCHISHTSKPFFNLKRVDHRVPIFFHLFVWIPKGHRDLFGVQILPCDTMVRHLDGKVHIKRCLSHTVIVAIRHLSSLFVPCWHHI